MPPWPAPSSVPDLLRQGAGLAFAEAVGRLYAHLTGRPAEGPVDRMLARLVDEDRVTPEAALYLTSAAAALARLQRTVRAAPPEAARAVPEVLGTLLRTGRLLHEAGRRR